MSPRTSPPPTAVRINAEKKALNTLPLEVVFKTPRKRQAKLWHVTNHGKTTGAYDYFARREIPQGLLSQGKRGKTFSCCQAK